MCGGHWVRILTTVDHVLPRARQYCSDGPIEALLLVAGPCWACICPKLTYLGVNGLLAPIHAPSRTARCIFRSRQKGAQNRHTSARGHLVRSRAALLLPVRADARAGAIMFDSAHGLDLQIKDRNLGSRFYSIKKG